MNSTLLENTGKRTKNAVKYVKGNQILEILITTNMVPCQKHGITIVPCLQKPVIFVNVFINTVFP